METYQENERVTPQISTNQVTSYLRLLLQLELMELGIQLLGTRTHR